ncbi:protein cereblon [Coccinella septempunctata]|uniref:protein cereblon n=1 Tax=Coccinella septempunctata TaxID=41139 RepID=UPI001D07E48A|nr:protein cereblon [Coccinella septempunctata]
MSDDEQNDEIENGHISSSLSPLYMVQNNSSDDDEVELVGDFNIDLPTSHRYLGKLNNLGGYTLFDDGEILNLLGIDTNTLVLPDFTLPLIFDNPHEGSVMQHFLKKSKVFVLLCTHYSKPSEFFEYGVIMEAFETNVRDGILSLKARGRQRCQIISEIKPLSERLQTVLVKVLPEHMATSPLADTQLYTLKKKKPFFCEDYADMKKIRKYRKYHVAQFTYPDWLYEEYEVCYFVKHILEGLKKCFIMEFVPKDPLKLSYWFIQNYLLQYQERLLLLQESTVLSRLRLEMKYLKSNRIMMCHSCLQCIAEQQHIIVLSKDGIQNNFVNPSGHVFETITVSDAKNFRLVGRPSRQFSWFPGYAWTIMQCSQCKSHLGWKFTSYTLTPKVFYGLAISCLVVRNETGSREDNVTF